MDAEDMDDMLKYMKSIAVSLEHLSNATWTNFNGDVTLAISAGGNAHPVSLKENN